jgi:hypothetical protein
MTAATFADPKREAAYQRELGNLLRLEIEGWSADYCAVMRHRLFVRFTENEEIPR